MARTGFKIAVFLALVVTVIAPRHAAAQCNIGYANGFGTPGPLLSNEGLKERPADISVASGGAPNCFSAGNVITVTYNGILSFPATLNNSSFPQYIVITNPGAAAGGTLTLGVTTTSGISAGGPQTVIQLTVLGPTTDPAAVVTLQNLRFDVNGLAPSQTLPATVMNAFVSGSAVGLTVPQHEQVGQVLSTISTTAPHTTSIVQGVGQQSSNGPLNTGQQAAFSFADAPGWSISPFRVANAHPAYPVGCAGAACTDTVDNPTTATSLVIDVESLPSGVAVTFPPTISVFPGGGVATPNFQWKLRNTTNGAGVAQAIYDTVLASTGQFNLVVSTGAAAADATPGAVGTGVGATGVTIGVKISSASGSGTATLRVVFGPGGNPPGVTAGAAFPGDDFNAAAAPNYTPFISTAGIGREIITDTIFNPLKGTDTAPTAWFTIAPTQSAILFQYATDRSGYNTGLAITNTGNDSTVFGTTGQTGSVTWYLFPNGAKAPIVYTTKSTDGTGLDAAGNLEPGNTLAITLDELLTAAGQTAPFNFSGYVIAVGQFNYGHGFDIIVDSQGRFTGINALFLGSAARLDTPGNGLPQ